MEDKKRVKLLKNKWFWIIALTGITVGIIWFASRGGDQLEFVTDEVVRETLVQTVEASGELESIDEVDLSFDTSGTVGEISFEEGDVVLAGDVIAMLSAPDLQAEVDKAEQAVQIAQAALNLERAGSTSEAVLVSQANVDIAEAALLAAETSLRNAQANLTSTINVRAADVSEKSVAYSSAVTKLNNVLAQNVQDIDEAQEEFISTMKSNLISIRSALSEADEVLGVDNQLANDDFQDVLSHQNPTYLNNAKSAYNRAKVSRDEAEGLVFVLTSLSTEEEIDAAAEAVEEAFDDAGETLLYTRQALDATSVDTLEFSSEDLSALKSGIDVVRNDVQMEESAFISDRQGLENAKITAGANEDDARSNVDAASQALTSAQVNRDDAVSDAEAAVASAEAEVAIREADLLKAEASLVEIQAGPRGVDVAGLEAEVERAKADLEAAQARLSKAEIISPIDGVVTRIDVEVGEQVIAAEVLVTVQTTTDDQFRIVADVPEADIPKVSLDDIVDVTFDAFGDDVHFTGAVRNIDPAEKTIEGVIFYEIDVYLEGDGEMFKPGLSSDVVVQTELIPEALVVPQRAILERDGQKYVRVPSGRTFEERFIEVGIRGDGGRTQILSGLQEGEEIIVTILE